MADVRLKGLSKTFNKRLAVDDLSLDIRHGEFFVLLGPTGAGKTTTLRLIAGLERPDKGSVSIGGRDVTHSEPAERDCAFVFQQYSLYPHLTVYDNLAFPLKSPLRRLSKEDIDVRVREVAETVHISHKLDSKATQLSGGEMQRVGIGRALVRRPNIYLMDEPLSSLDARLRSDLRLELKRIQQDTGATLLYVTHDQIEAMTMASRIGILENGRLVQCGTPREIYENPASVYVATRLGTPRINLLPAGVIPAGSEPTGTSVIGVRTEHVVLGDPSSSASKARIGKVERLGDQTFLHVDVEGHKLVLLADPHVALEADRAVGLSLRAPLFFAADGARIHAGQEARQ
ncbi:ABC transporter ATP-binding protein [Flaviflagellibacter deserti]|uniref:ABC transporter ATP-binding protein n=1 Tax=Flaviflagellibacter deserti TaxID=2267266 RepID=A0ABV9YZ66_9HYPH